MADPCPLGMRLNRTAKTPAASRCYCAAYPSTGADDKPNEVSDSLCASDLL